MNKKKTISFCFLINSVQLFSPLTPQLFNRHHGFMEPGSTSLSTQSPTIAKERHYYLELVPFQLHNRADLANNHDFERQIRCSSKPCDGTVHVCPGYFYLQCAALVESLAHIKKSIILAKGINEWINRCCVEYYVKTDIEDKFQA